MQKELSKLIREKSASKISHMFGVSYSAVRKWLVKYGLKGCAVIVGLPNISRGP